MTPDPSEYDLIDDINFCALPMCRCGHGRAEHYRGGNCLASTPTETWACSCDEYAIAADTTPAVDAWDELTSGLPAEARPLAGQMVRLIRAMGGLIDWAAELLGTDDPDAASWQAARRSLEE